MGEASSNCYERQSALGMPLTPSKTWVDQHQRLFLLKDKSASKALRRALLLDSNAAVKNCTAALNQYICVGSCPHPLKTAQLLTPFFTPSTRFKEASCSLWSWLSNSRPSCKYLVPQIWLPYMPAGTTYTLWAITEHAAGAVLSGCAQTHVIHSQLPFTAAQLHQQLLPGWHSCQISCLSTWSCPYTPKASH